MAQGYSPARMLTAAMGLAVGAAPALAAAHDDQAQRSGWHNGSWYGDAPPPQASAPYPDPRLPHHAGAQYDPRARDAWLADCRQRVAARDDGVGGAVIGGVVGGVAGNRIAGRGNRTVGTVAGAAVGAVAGAAIDRAEDRGRARNECDAYLDDYYARYAAGYAQPGYGGYAYPGYGYPGYAPTAGYPAGCCTSAPVMMVPAPAAPQCTETVEYIYEDVPVRPRARRHVRDKRVKIVPDKRVSIK
jgi:glycine zipper 2TM protein